MSRTREVVFLNVSMEMGARSVLDARARVEAIRLYARHHPKWGGQPMPASYPADAVARVRTDGTNHEVVFRVYHDTFDLHPSRRGLVPANGEFILTSWSAVKTANEDIGA